jgi:phosphatidylglycerophosphate synthase
MEPGRSHGRHVASAGEGEPASIAWLQAANAVTLLRVLAIPAFVWAVWRADAGGPSPLPALLFFLAVGSDLSDGKVARRLGVASEAGRFVDHIADISFLTSALAAYWSVGAVPWWVPVSVVASFLFYVVDSWRQSGLDEPRRLIGSRLGHLAGIFNYTIVGVVACNESAGLHWLPAGLVWMLFAMVPLYSAAAVVSRVLSRSPVEAGRN